MTTFGVDLVQSLGEALAHAKGDGPAIVHSGVTPREVREAVNLTQAQMELHELVEGVWHRRSRCAKCLRKA